MKYLLFILWVTLIISVCIGSMSTPLNLPPHSHWDKAIHLGANFFMALYPFFLCRTKFSYYCTIILIVMFGIVIEIIQQNIPDRTASLGDVAANTAGVLLALMCICVLKKSFGRNPTKKAYVA